MMATRILPHVFSVALVSTIALIPLASNAQDMPLAFGNDYLKTCENPSSDTTKALCAGWFAGLLNGLQFGNWAFVAPEEIPEGYDPFEAYGACLDADVKNGQILDVFVKFLRDNPAQRHYSSASLFVASLSEAFPCE